MNEVWTGTETQWEHGPPTRTVNLANLVRCHWHPKRRVHWKALVLLVLLLADEFLCGRFERLCLLRCELESKWTDYSIFSE